MPTEPPEVFTYNNGLRDFACFRSNGFQVYIHFQEQEKAFRALTMPDGVYLGQMEFMPFDSSRFQKDKRSAAVAKFIKGLSDFFDKCGSQALPTPYALHCVTNPRMANFFRRFGFISSPTENPNELEIVGQTTHVKQNLELVKTTKINGLPLEDLICQRVSRQVGGSPEISSPYFNEILDAR